jgi:hypothetical protein
VAHPLAPFAKGWGIERSSTVLLRPSIVIPSRRNQSQKPCQAPHASENLQNPHKTLAIFFENNLPVYPTQFAIF